MNKPVKYFVFNKEKDYQRGFRDNIVVDQKKISINNIELKSGVFFSYLIDSGENDAPWYRFLMNADIPANTIVKITFYSSNSIYFIHEDNLCSVESIIYNEFIASEEKSRILSYFDNETFINPSDALLTKIKGRYLWFSVFFHTEQTHSPVVEKIKIFIRSKTWIEYLPETFQTSESEFTQRYLAIFQNLYDSMTEQIKKSSSGFEIGAADREMLNWIASWTGVKNTDLWNDDQLRYILKNVVRVHKSTGTAQLISEMITLYTGTIPIIKENCDVYRQLSDSRLKKLYTDLYTDSMYTFTVLIRSEDLKSHDDYNSVIKIIEQYKPVHMNANVVLLKPYIMLDKYSYLGVNSTLGQCARAALDSKTEVSFAILGE